MKYDLNSTFHRKADPQPTAESTSLCIPNNDMAGSLWGSKRDDEEEHNQVNGEAGENSTMRASHDEPRPRSSRSRREPNERDRLLGAHQPPHSDGYLDPDDPAVSSTWHTLIHSGGIDNDSKTDTSPRSPHTTFGPSALCASSPCSSWPSLSSGGCSYL